MSPGPGDHGVFVSSGPRGAESLMPRLLGKGLSDLPAFCLCKYVQLRAVTGGGGGGILILQPQLSSSRVCVPPTVGPWLHTRTCALGVGLGLLAGGPARGLSLGFC